MNNNKETLCIFCQQLFDSRLGGLISDRPACDACISRISKVGDKKNGEYQELKKDLDRYTGGCANCNAGFYVSYQNVLRFCEKFYQLGLEHSENN